VSTLLGSIVLVEKHCNFYKITGQHPVKEFANLPQQECTHCLRFQCMDNISKCDNPNETNFDGPDPPCCVHIQIALIILSGLFLHYFVSDHKPQGHYDAYL
jgi:hypothetical protein